MSEHHDDAAAVPAVAAAEQENRQLRRQLADTDSRLGTLETSALHGAILLTSLILVAGLMLPFFVAAKSDLRSATLWEGLSADDAPEVVSDAGGFWFIPLAATLIVLAVLVSWWYGSGSGKGRTAGRVLLVAYLIGCLLGMAVLSSDNQRPSLDAMSPGMLAFTIGAVLAVGISFSPVLQNIKDRH